MFTAGIAFLLGILAGLQLRELPGMEVTIAIAAVAVVFLFSNVTRLPALALLGFCWLAAFASHRLEHSLPTELEGEAITVSGVVAGLPEQNARRTRFLFAIDTLHIHNTDTPLSLLGRISWYRTNTKLRAGERWTLTLKLKRPHGFRNPGGFDYEAWLFRKGIRATGYVLGKQAQIRIDEHVSQYPLDRIRQNLAGKITAAAGGLPNLGGILALALGERALISPEQWKQLTRSGTNHLFAISGLHIGLIATMVYFVAGWAWRLFAPLHQRIPRPAFCWSAAIIAACGYAALAGFSLPTQRALAMILVAGGYVLMQARFAPLSGLGLALLLVLILDPLAPLGADFWLSFGAVGIIFLHVAGRVAAVSRWKKLFSLQIVIAIGLAPLLVAQFGLVPTASVIANLLAVPWVGLLIVPVTLVGVGMLWVNDAVARSILSLADGLIAVFWRALEISIASDWLPVISLPYSFVIVVTLGLLVLLLLSPRGAPISLLCVILLGVAGVSASRPQPLPGKLQVTVFDVGQGLSVLVRTTTKTLLYDTGMRFSDTFDAASAVITPALQSMGVRELDAVIVSHGDLDHRGGLSSLLEQAPARRIVSGEPDDLSVVASQCRAGDQWVWDEIEFTILHPNDTNSNASSNNRSCVLKVAVGNTAVLLPGDIEASAEMSLLASTDLTSTILVAPHHGSGSSSSAAFIDAVDPQHVVYAVGYRNRFAFPVIDVDARYRQRDVRRWRTDMDGAITFDWSKSENRWLAYAYRNDQLRFWHNKPSNPAFTGIDE